MASSTPTKAILFLGATGGCAFSALRRSLAAGYACIALCRDPSKLSAKLSPEHQMLVRLEKGNAHDAEAVMRSLIHPSKANSVVDYIVSAIGNAPTLDGMRHSDSDVCRKGISVLLQSVEALRDRGFAGRPRIVAVSSTGISDHGRDIPLAMIPLYKVALAVPHRDKKAMETALIRSNEDWTVVRPSWLTDGEGGKTRIREGIENAGQLENKAIGYTISREDVGKWIFENIVEEWRRGGNKEWVQKIATVTY